MAVRDLVRWGGAGKRGVPVRRAPDHPFFSLQREMNDLFERMFEGFDLAPVEWPGSTLGAFAPRVDVAETEKEVQVSAELPGIEEKDVEVTLSDGALTIRGERREEKEEKEKDWYRREQSYGSFHRTIALPSEIDPDKVEATFKKGVLKVTLPKAPAAQAKKVSVKVD